MNFTGRLKASDQMFVKDLTELKAKFNFVMTPVMAVKFVQKTWRCENAAGLLYEGLAMSPVVTSPAVFDFDSVMEKEDRQKEPRHG